MEEIKPPPPKTWVEEAFTPANILQASRCCLGYGAHADRAPDFSSARFAELRSVKRKVKCIDEMITELVRFANPSIDWKAQRSVIEDMLPFLFQAIEPEHCASFFLDYALEPALELVNWRGRSVKLSTYLNRIRSLKSGGGTFRDVVGFKEQLAKLKKRFRPDTRFVRQVM